ncbi:HTH-type transcriptional regulator SutR [bioreactor metagenome]|uniref:HTH-type transcriptional regulator SutR n=1 Tax=bioreactor metagenome TaxID=1076179 RepID=A0A644XR02_9ZZZZ
MAQMKLCVGERLKMIRQSKGLSLDEVSKLTAVSKPALAQIERGTSSPTVNTLWKISNGLSIPLSYLLQEQEEAFKIVDLESHEPISEYGQAMKAYALFPYEPTRNIEIFHIEFAAGCEHKSARHLDGVEEYVFVLSGALTLTFGSQSCTLHEGQAIRFGADINHTYQNPFDRPCTIINIIYYPNR